MQDNNIKDAPGEIKTSVKKSSGRGRSLFLAFLAALVVLWAGFYFFKMPAIRGTSKTAIVNAAAQEFVKPVAMRTSTVTIYYPISGGLQKEERKARADLPIAEAVMSEFFKGATGANSGVPANVKVAGIYKADDGIIYISLTEEFRGNFKGDVFAEFLLLKGIYETLRANLLDASDVKLLIDGKEIDSLGGHFSLVVPLGATVSSLSLEAKK